jgi:hypothetical protein
MTQCRKSTGRTPIRVVEGQTVQVTKTQPAVFLDQMLLLAWMVTEHGDLTCSHSLLLARPGLGARNKLKFETVDFHAKTRNITISAKASANLHCFLAPLMRFANQSRCLHR